MDLIRKQEFKDRYMMYSGSSMTEATIQLQQKAIAMRYRFLMRIML